jgi:hypothetical protein
MIGGRERYDKWMGDAEDEKEEKNDAHKGDRKEGGNDTDKQEKI